LADDFAFMTIRELGNLIRRREASVEEVVREAITRTERLDPKLNSYITIAAEQAVDPSRRADAEIRQRKYRGPLHGIPISIKDHLDTAGIPTTAGSKVLDKRVPQTDAIVVRKLKEAGAIIIGKANMNRFAAGESGWNPDYGKIRNPRNLEFSPGGSSGGSGAQVGAGLVALSVGSDNGGSVRIPAALCGVVGIKPTFGRVSMDGMAPRSYSADHVGPLTRTVDDAALALEIMSGHVAGSSTTAPRPVLSYSKESGHDIRGLRLGVDRKYCSVGQPAVLDGFARALTRFQELGGSIRDVSMPSFDEMFSVFDVIFQPEIGLWYAALIKEHATEMSADITSGLKPTQTISAFDYLRACQRRREIQIVFARATRDVDLVALPTYFLAQRPFPPNSGVAIGGYPQIGGYTPTVYDGLRYTLPFNFLGLPAISIPCALNNNGGAVGLQIVGRAFDEITVLRAAHAYEQSTEWHRRPAQSQS